MARPTPRRQRRKEAKESKRLRKVDYYSSRNALLKSINEKYKNDLKNEAKDSLKSSSGNFSTMSNVDMSAGPKKKVRWHSNIIPTDKELLDSYSSDEEDLRASLGLPTSCVESKVQLEQQTGGPRDDYDLVNSSELIYLENQLGLSSNQIDRQKFMSRLKKELCLLDGFDEDILAFTDDCLDSSNVDVRGEEAVCNDDEEDSGQEVDCLPPSPNESQSGSDRDGDEDLELEYLESNLGLRGPNGSKNLQKLKAKLLKVDQFDEGLLNACLNENGTYDFGDDNDMSDELGGSSQSHGGVSQESDDDDIRKLGGNSRDASIDRNSIEESGFDDGDEKQHCDKSRGNNNDNNNDNKMKDAEINNNNNGLSAPSESSPSRGAQPLEKYTPPALRKKKQSSIIELPTTADATDAFEREIVINQIIKLTLNRVSMVITGLVNRIAEGNLIPMTRRIIDEYFNKGITYASTSFRQMCQKKSSNITAFPKEQIDVLLSEMSLLYSEKIIAASIKSLGSTVSLVASQAAVIAALSANLSYRICQQHIISLIKIFEYYWAQIEDFCPSKGQHVDDEISVENLSNLRAHLRLTVTSFALLFDFDLLSPSGIFSFIYRLFDSFSVGNSILIETQLDLVLTCLRHAGVKLRTRFPSDFREILVYLSTFVNKVESSSPLRKSTDRLSYLLNELEDLKNGKINQHSSNRLNFIRQWLKNSRDFEGIDWSHYMFSFASTQEIKLDKLWIAIFQNRIVPECPAGQLVNQKVVRKFQIQSNKKSEIEKLLDKATKYRLHTDLQKGIFVALMGSHNPQNAVQRILEVANKKTYFAHIVAVILHICLRQKIFNPFYPQVVCELCSLPSSMSKHFKKGVRQGVAAQLSQTHNFTIKLIDNFAKFITYLCMSVGQILEFRCVRFLNFESDDTTLREKNTLLLQQILIELCQTEGQTEEEKIQLTEVFERQIQGISKMDDISEMIVLICKSMILPFIKDSIAAERAHKIIHILSS